MWAMKLPNEKEHRSRSLRKGWSFRAIGQRLRLGLPTALGITDAGYFIPYRHAGQSPAPANYPEIESIFRAAEGEMLGRLADIEQLSRELHGIKAEAEPPEPRWNQDWFPWLDAAMAYAMVRTLKPSTWLEIGSGHSTRFVTRAISDGNLKTRLIAIDPAPRANLSGLKVEWHPAVAQGADPALYRALGAGDVLFVDSSHILMPGTDVDFVINQVLPILPSGIHLHVHDVFLPDGYPEEWSWRGYNEQNAVGALIISGAWKIVGASHYMATRLNSSVMGGILAQLPRSAGPVSSLWLRKL